MVNEDKNSLAFFNPLVPQGNKQTGYYPQNGPTKEDYQKYGVVITKTFVDNHPRLGVLVLLKTHMGLMI